MDQSAAVDRIVADVLGREQLPDAASFLELGGTSLLAMRAVAVARTDLGIRLPLRALLTHRPVREVIAEAAPAGDEDGVVTEADQSAATPGQRGMWAAEQTVGGQMYGLVFTAFLDGPLNVAALRRCIDHAVARHDGLRTMFVVDDGELRRRVLPDWRAPLAEQTAPDRFSGGEQFRTWVRHQGDAAGRAGLDLDAGPPLRLVLFRNGIEQHALTVLTHHLLLDVWAIGLLFDEILARYAHATGGARPTYDAPVAAAMQARHHRVLAESGELNRQHAWWTDRLGDIDPVIQLPARRPRPEQRRPAGRRLPFDLGRETSDAVRAGATAAGVTPFSVLLSAFARVVGERAGRDRFVVGVPIAGRDATALPSLVAQCARVVPVTVVADHDTMSFVRATQESLNAALDHPDVPLDTLAPELAPAGDASRNPLVQLVCGDYSQLVRWTRTIGPLRIDIEEGHCGGAPMDVTIAYQGAPDGDPQRYAGTLEFSTDALGAREAQDLLEAYVAEIENVAESCLSAARPALPTS